MFVVKANATPVQEARNGLDLLRRVEAPVTGVVLTQLDLRKAGRDSGYDYERYEASFVPKMTET